MAIAATYFASLVDTTNTTAYTQATITFTSGNLYLVFVAFTDAEATAEVPTSVTLSGATPPTVTRATGATATFNTVASPLFRLTTWWFYGDGVSRTVTATMPDAGSGCIIYTVEVTGMHTSSPIVQAVGNQGDAGATMSATLAAFADATNNGAIVFAHVDTNNQISAEAGGVWTEFNAGNDANNSTPASRCSGAFRLGQDTTPTMTSAATPDWGCVALEIAKPAGGTTHSKTFAGTGTGTNTFTAKTVRNRTSALTGTGTNTYAGKVVRNRTAALTGTGTLSAAGKRVLSRTAALTSTSSEVFEGHRLGVVYSRTAALTATSSEVFVGAVPGDVTVLTATYLRPDGQPCKGRVRFRRVPTEYQDLTHWPTTPVTATLTDGEISLVLEPNDDDTVYEVKERIKGATRDAYYITIPDDPTVNLGSLATYPQPIPRDTR